MPTEFTISSFSGSSPFSIYLCDTGQTTCIYIDTISSGSVPYVFNSPSILDSLTEYTVKTIDASGCTVTNIIDF
jgi:hypothetical protein